MTKVIALKNLDLIPEGIYMDLIQEIMCHIELTWNTGFIINMFMYSQIHYHQDEVFILFNISLIVYLCE